MQLTIFCTLDWVYVYFFLPFLIFHIYIFLYVWTVFYFELQLLHNGSNQVLSHFRRNIKKHRWYRLLLFDHLIRSYLDLSGEVKNKTAVAAASSCSASRVMKSPSEHTSAVSLQEFKTLIIKKRKLCDQRRGRLLFLSWTLYHLSFIHCLFLNVLLFWLPLTL